MTGDTRAKQVPKKSGVERERGGGGDSIRGNNGYVFMISSLMIVQNWES